MTRYRSTAHRQIRKFGADRRRNDASNEHEQTVARWRRCGYRLVVDMDWLDETHRRVGAICNRSTWLEYQLEIAYMELAVTADLSATQGQWYSTLIRMIKQVLAKSVVIHEGHDPELRDLLSRISATMKLRDHVVHSTWIRKNSTKPGHVTGQRWYRN